MSLAVQPGDVLVVHDASFWADVIRLGPKVHNLLLHDHQPDKWNHVCIVMPDDPAGTRWAVEGRPGGFGYRDLSAAGYLDSPLTLSNVDQPKTDRQRADICELGDAMAARKVNYDWAAIVADGLRVVDPLWALRDRWGPGAPGHVVCSSGADWVYERIGLASPRPDRYCTPADWAAFDLGHAWAS